MTISECLYPYQRETAEFMKRGSCLNASFCGSGKTITTLAAITELGHTTNLIICPKSVLYNWQNEINHWLPGRAKAFVASGSAKARKAAYASFLEATGTKFLVMTYDSLRLFMSVLQYEQFDAVVFDEVHYCVNIQSKRYKACRALQAKVKYGLTATPIMNKATDIFGCVNVVRGPVLGNWFGFLNRYCVKDVWGSVKYYKNMPELQARVAPYIIRKTWTDAGFIPPPEAIDLEFELSAKETKLYNDIRQELLFELDPILVSKLSSPMILQNTLTKLGKLQELTDGLLLGDSPESSKLDTLKEHLGNSLTDEKSKAIIFTRFSRMADILEKALAVFAPVVLTGQTTARQEAIDEFTNNPARKVFICTEAGGAGINLQSANIVYNYDLPFSLGKLEQRNGRLRHHMQDRPVFIYNLMAKLEGGKNTIDQFVANKIIKKQDMSDKLLLSDIKEMLT